MNPQIDPFYLALLERGVSQESRPKSPREPSYLRDGNPPVQASVLEAYEALLKKLAACPSGAIGRRVSAD